MKRVTTLQKIWICLLTLCLCTCLFTFPVFAGDWIDHGGDWGGSDWDSDWDSNYDSDWGSDWDRDYDSDWGGSSSGSGTNYGFFGIGTLVAIVVIVIYFVVVAAGKRNRAGRSTTRSSTGYSTSPLQMSDTSRVDVQSLQQLKASDPQFSEAAMLSKAENLFTTLQLAWCDQDYEPVRPFLSNALYEQQAKQLEAKKTRDEKNVSSEIAVLQSKLESYSTDGHTEYLNVWLRVKMKDYIVRISDPSVIVTGTPDRMYYLDFRWQFTRSAGAVTNAATDAVKTGECPCCGANINMNQSGRCEYCGSVISTTEYDWVLSKIDGLQQRSR